MGELLFHFVLGQGDAHQSRGCCLGWKLVNSSSHQTVGASWTLLSQLSQGSHGHELSLTLVLRKRKLVEVSWWLSVLGLGPSCAPAGLQAAVHTL